MKKFLSFGLSLNCPPIHLPVNKLLLNTDSTGIFKGVQLYIFTELNNHLDYLMTTFSSPQEETPYLQIVIVASCSSLPTAPGHCESPFSLFGFAFLDIACRWNQTTCGLGDWLLSLSVVFSRFMYVVAYVRTSVLFMVVSYSIIWIYTTFFYPFLS